MSIELVKSNFVVSPFPAQITEYLVRCRRRDGGPSTELTLRLTEKENEKQVKVEFIDLSTEYHIDWLEEALEQLAEKMERGARELRSRGRPAVGLPRYPDANP